MTSLNQTPGIDLLVEHYIRNGDSERLRALGYEKWAAVVGHDRYGQPLAIYEWRRRLKSE